MAKKDRAEKWLGIVARTLNCESTADILDKTKQMHTWILERKKEKVESLTR